MTTNSVPFTDVASDFAKLVNVEDNKKSQLIDFAASDFASLRQALIDYIKAVYPLDYQNFQESDLGVMLIELVSYMGAVLSYKADALAHENLLQTAKQRESVRKLLELIGVAMKGPTSAQADCTLTIPDTVTGSEFYIKPENRTITVISPEDGQQLTYTVYGIKSGQVEDLLNSSGSVLLDANNLVSESGGVSSWDGVLLEGAFAVDTGTFDEVDVLKSVALTESPVVQNSVQVYVNEDGVDTSYRQVESLFQASSTDDKVFEVVYGTDFKATVQFGNGTTGASPPTNSDYTIIYRVGGGSRGNIPDSYINSTVTATKTNESTATATVLQTSIATGGADAETVEHAKKYAPLTFRTQNRLVSLDDYVAFVNRFVSPAGTTGKATAVNRKAFSSANVIDVYVLEKASDVQLQKASLTFKNQLLSDIEGLKMLTDEVILVDGLIRTVDLSITINLDERYRNTEGTVVSKVSNAVQTYFLSDNVDFGDPLILADLNRAIFEVDEVRFSSIDNLDKDIHIDFNEIIQLNNLTINVNFV